MFKIGQEYYNPFTLLQGYMCLLDPVCVGGFYKEWFLTSQKLAIIMVNNFFSGAEVVTTRAVDVGVWL